MIRNMGTIDRLIRFLLSLVMMVLWMGGFVSGVAGILLAVLGVVLLSTAAIGFCPLYLPIKLNTKK